MIVHYGSHIAMGMHAASAHEPVQLAKLDRDEHTDSRSW